jgi:hypothetical protein
MPNFAEVSDVELRKKIKSDIVRNKTELPKGATEELFVDAVIYQMKTSAGEELPLPEGGIEKLVTPELGRLPDGITADTTVRELMKEDRAFFGANIGSFRLLALLSGVFFTIVSVLFLRMARAWRRGDPFGPVTVSSLRWLGFLFLAKVVAATSIPFCIPQTDPGDLLFFSGIYKAFAEGFNGGASLSCGILFLTLSWVLESGRKMKEEQALTI